MAINIVTAWNSVLVKASDHPIVANEQITLLSSAQVPNANFNSLKATLTYKDLSPANVLGSFYLSTVVEFKDDTNQWQSLPVYQFSPLRKSSQAPQRILILQPNLDTFNLGIDDVIYPTTKETARISRAQGTLPASAFRLSLVLTEQDPGGPAAFQSVVVKAETEQYNV